MGKLIYTNTNNNIDKYQECFIKVLHNPAPLRVKYIRENQKPHLTKTLRKAIHFKAYI